METNIEFLALVEEDLMRAAAREAELDRRASGKASRPPRRFRGNRSLVSIAAGFVALLVIAGAIGTLDRASRDSAGGPASKFSQVGSAVGGGGEVVPGSAPQGVDYISDEGRGDVLEPTATGGEPGTEAPKIDIAKIIRNGEIGITVPDGSFSDSSTEVIRLAHRYGGYVLNTDIENDRVGKFTLRVPSRYFDETMIGIRELSTDVDFQRSTGKDVTADFIDLRARIDIYKTRRTVLLDLLGNSKSSSETLNFQNQLGDLQLLIEELQGRLNFLDNQVDVSTITVTIKEATANAPEAADPQSIDNPDLGTSWDRGVQGFLRVLGAIVIGLGYLVPLLAIALVAWVILKLARRRRGAI